MACALLYGITSVISLTSVTSIISVTSVVSLTSIISVTSVISVLSYFKLVTSPPTKERERKGFAHLSLGSPREDTST